MEEEKKFKLMLYPTIAVIVIILFVVIINIWSPTVKKVKKDTINSYTDSNYEESVKKYYKTYLQENLKITNFDKLYTNIDDEYIKSLNLNTVDDVKNYLKENSYISMTPEIISFEIYEKKRDNYIIVKYKVKDTIRYVNIKEERPYVFTVSFMDDYDLSQSITDFKLEGTVEEVDYKFDIVNSTKNNIKIKVTITNNSNKNITYDFSYLDSVQLLYADNITINIASIANSESSKVLLSTGSMISIELSFNLPYEDQLTISGAKINNANIDGNPYSVQI